MLDVGLNKEGGGWMVNDESRCKTPDVLPRCVIGADGTKKRWGLVQSWRLINGLLEGWKLEFSG